MAELDGRSEDREYHDCTVEVEGLAEALGHRKPRAGADAALGERPEDGDGAGEDGGRRGAGDLVAPCLGVAAALAWSGAAEVERLTA